MNKSQQVFFELVRAGLWEKDARLLPYGEVDYEEVMRLAEEQTVVGLVAAGIEHVEDAMVPKEIIFQFIGQALQLEQRNSSMNKFIGLVVEKLRNDNVYAVLVKGQGIAQCYEKPLWRSCGDVDLLLSEDNYNKAKALLTIKADSIEPENGKHVGMTLGQWVVELHGNLHCGLSTRMDKKIDEVQDNVFIEGNIRSWKNENTYVFLPGVDDDVIFIFTHFLKHFYKGGLGLRQICDWCRLLWSYRNTINLDLLEKRLSKMGLMSEWCAFGAYAVDYLGMPKEAMPLYSDERVWSKKADRINKFILSVGNMGHNRDKNCSGNNAFIIRKFCSFSRRLCDICNHVMIFPLDSVRFSPSLFLNGLRSAVKGVG